MRRISITLATVAAVITMLRAAGGPAAQTGVVHFVGKTKYLNNARAVVVHTIDDSTKLVVDTADAMDKYDIKGTFFISTEQDPPPEACRRLAADRLYDAVEVEAREVCARGELIAPCRPLVQAP